MWNTEGLHFRVYGFGGLPFTLIYSRLATIINLIIAINVSRLLCRALQTYNEFTIIHFMAELYQKDLLGSVHFA